MKQFKGIIYQAINIQNGKSYIGKTTQNFEKYVENHIKGCFKNRDKKKKYFYNAIRKYGAYNFKWVVLGEIYSYNLGELNKELDLSEIEAVWLFRTFGSNGIKQDGIYGYNLTPGGSGIILSGEDHWNYGKKQSEEWVSMMKENNKGEGNGRYKHIDMTEFINDLLYYMENSIRISKNTLSEKYKCSWKLLYRKLKVFDMDFHKRVCHYNMKQPQLKKREETPGIRKGNPNLIRLGSKNPMYKKIDIDSLIIDLEYFINNDIKIDKTFLENKYSCKWETMRDKLKKYNHKFFNTIKSYNISTKFYPDTN